MIERVLARTRTIAVIGASRDPMKSAHSVPAMLQREGYRIIPVNPHADELFGERVHRTLATVDEPIDLVDVFRRPEHTPDVARSAAASGAGALWLQLGVVNWEAAQIAHEAGMPVVIDRCTAIEHRRIGR